MRSPTTTTVVTYTLLGLASAVALTLPSNLGPRQGAARPMPLAADTVLLDGIIRDFPSTHPDFKATASGGNGHYAGNIGLLLGATDRPVFTGAGYKVNKQWQDRFASNIAPHLYTAPGLLRLTSAPVVSKDAFFDTWDSSKGPYGPTNQGPAPSYATNSLMPSITEPKHDEVTSGNAFFQLTATLDTDLYCDSFTTRRDTILSVTGHRTVVCEFNFAPGQGTQILIMPNSSLRLYVKGAISINQATQVNMNTMDPTLCRIYNLGTTSVEINQGNQVCAVIISPNAPMHLAQNDHFYGTFVGKGLQLDQTTGFHADTRPILDPCGSQIADSAGTRGGNSTGGISSAATFNQWFIDVMGVNLSARHSLELTLANDGAYEYITSAFHPIDGALLGDEGMAHNYYFTFAASTTFTHHSCDSRFFEFSGADDAWLFIDGRLVIDLGGVAPLTNQRITMDRLDLVDGQVYRLDFFYAQRQSTVTRFGLRTNLDLAKHSVPYTVSAGID